MAHVIPTPSYPEVPVSTGGTFPVRRIFCIAKNYRAEPRPPEGDPSTGLPPLFMKPADAIHLGGDLLYPLATENLHFETELVVALKAGGTFLNESDLEDCIFGYAAGCDLTRRDQLDACRENKGPWDMAKTLDDGAVIGPITPDSRVRTTGKIGTKINGEVRQDSDLNHMIWSVAGIITKLSTAFELKAGDLIYTGTPPGVGEIKAGETMEMLVENTEPVSFTLVPR